MIRFENVSKSYDGGQTFAVNDLSLEVAEGETVVLLGTSGSGKTTTMKMVNRLIEITEGAIFVNGRDIYEQSPIQLRRSIGDAIQHIGLFPHMTIAENIAVVPNLLNWSRKEIDDRVDRMLEMVSLDPGDFRERYPTQLSGGQKQRIGVARALAGDPPIILMDEPFGALDPITREQLQNEFLELESEIKKTILFVTHDVFEAVKMGDRVALMDAGEVQQLATPRELVDSPANEFVDAFLGQHRFQLALLTRNVRAHLQQADTESPAPAQRPANALAGHFSLIEALDRFKTSGKTTLAVYDRGQFRGYLTQKQLLASISDVFQEAGS